MNQKLKLLLLFLILSLIIPNIIPNLWALENGLVVNDTYISDNRYLTIDYEDYSSEFKNTDLVVFYVINNSNSSPVILNSEATKFMYDFDLIKENANNRSQFLNSFQLDERFSDTYGLRIIKANEEKSLTLDLNCFECEDNVSGFNSLNQITLETRSISIFLARYDVGRNLFIREQKASLVDKTNLSKDSDKYTSTIFGKYIKQEYMFEPENLESTVYSFVLEYELETEEKDLAITPLPILGKEGELEPLQIIEQQESKENPETQDQETITEFSSFNSNKTDLNASFNLSNQIKYKVFSISYYTLKENKNLKKRIYTFNQGRTQVIRNIKEEITKDKVIDIKLNLDRNTEKIYLIFDKSQSGSIPSRTQFVNQSTSTIEIISNQTRYIKINKSILQDNKITINLKGNIENFSFQILEEDNTQNITAVYGTNILQLDDTAFNKYTLFQVNKNAIEFYCPDCQLKDYGVNENSFSSCGLSLLKDTKSITDTLSEKENICLLPDGSRISGFTKDASKVFGFDKLYFDWSEQKISSDIFDYGEYYVDQDQFRIAISKKLDAINNNEYIEISGIKYKKGKNNLVSKVSTYQEYNLGTADFDFANVSIDSSLNYSIVLLDQIPKEYQKLTILDLVNNEPAVSETEFEKIMQEILKASSDYYKVKDYHTHYQITLEKYISSINDFKDYNSIAYSNLLYGLYYKTTGYSNIYFSESLDYFIYNIKPFTDLDGETKKILNNEYTKFLSNSWSLELLNTEEVTSVPKTVIVKIEEILPATHSAKIKIENTSAKLSFDYYSNNPYYSYNPLFKESINAKSYNYAYLFETSNSIKSKNTELGAYYQDIQDGKIVTINNSNYKINLTAPIIIRKETSDNIIIKYFDGKEYKEYSKDLIAVSNSPEDFPTKETIMIYPQKSKDSNPLIIESSEPLLFNVENVDYSIISNKYVYYLPVDDYSIKLSNLVSEISNGNSCFSVTDDSFSIWENIDEELYFKKEQSYGDFSYVFSESQSVKNTIPVESLPEVNNAFAIYNLDESAKFYKQVHSVNAYLQEETENKNLNILKNYSLVYSELLKSDTKIYKNFTEILSCNETLICQVSKTKYIPEGQFFERFKNVCVPNTPSQCVSFWSNPKVNYCSAFVRNFNFQFFGYNFDSADAWDLAKQPNNKSIWKATTGALQEKDFDFLIPGSVLGIKHNNTSYTQKAYSHVVVYLGKIGSNHYIIHSWGNTLKIEKLDVFLKTTARGKNSYGVNEDGQIKEILISNNLYSKLKTKAKEKTIILGEADSSIFEGVVPDYIFDKFNSSILVSNTTKTEINNLMYKELEEVYNRILQKEFDTYYKTNYSINDSLEINKKIKLDSSVPMIVILGGYKKLFLVNKENGKTNIISQYPLSTGVNGFGCVNDSQKTPIGLFRIVQKVGQDCSKLQIIGPGGCEYNDGKPVLASYNSGTAYVVTRKLVIDGLEKDNIGVGCDNGNRNTIYRGIYIHGTNLERSMGQQKSHGCIRMLNDDVVNLFNMVPTGTYIYVYSSDTSYSSLLGLENKLTNSETGFNPQFIKSGTETAPKKTTADVDNYINSKINSLAMLNKNTNVSLNYASCSIQKNLKFNCYIQEALDIEYNQHVLTQQSTEFNYIIFRVAKTFNYTLEETAQFWGSLAQESGTSTNIDGKESKNGKSLAGKPAKGIAQIEKGPWSNYYKNRETFKAMVPFFSSVDLSPIIEKDSKINTVTTITGNKYTIDSVKEIEAILNLIWKNNSKYASVVFSAGLKRYLANKLITNTSREPRPFYHSMYITYDHPDSLNYDFALIYKYKYTSSGLMYSGIKQYGYSELRDSEITVKTIVLKLANYLAFKKEIYMYRNGLKNSEESDLLIKLLNANNQELPK